MLAQGYRFQTKEEIDADRANERKLDLARELGMDRYRTSSE
jgi:hypothetical protein